VYNFFFVEGRGKANEEGEERERESKRFNTKIKVMNNKKKNKKKTFCASKLYLNTLFLTMKNKSILTFKSQFLLKKKNDMFHIQKKKKSFKRFKKKNHVYAGKPNKTNKSSKRVY
jgi:hypothetical protein